MGLVACPAIGNQQVRNFFLFVMQCRLTLILVICAGHEFNKALSSGLIAEEGTRQLLEIVVVEHDYRVALSEENLKASGLWAFVEERQGTLALPLDFLLPILRFRHAIHVTFGGCDLYPLTPDELSLVEGMMSGRFSIPFAKDAKKLLKGAASSSQKEKKRKRDPSRHVGRRRPRGLQTEQGCCVCCSGGDASRVWID